jgi:hypothetical protein
MYLTQKEGISAKGRMKREESIKTVAILLRKSPSPHFSLLVL